MKKNHVLTRTSLMRPLVVALGLGLGFSALDMPAAYPADPDYADVTYDTVPGGDGNPLALKLDVYLPGGISPVGGWPAIVYVHGGGWKAGDKAENKNKDVARAAANEGLAVFAVNYRMPCTFTGSNPICGGTNFQFPIPVDDVNSAISWIRNNGNNYDANVDELGGLGPSAGGHLIAQASLDGGAKADYVVSWSAPLDHIEAWNRNQQGIEGALVPERLNFLGSFNQSVWEDASPAYQAAGAGLPEIFMYNSINELIPEQEMENTEAAYVAAGQGGKATTCLIPGNDHGISISTNPVPGTCPGYDPGSPGKTIAKESYNWLKSKLGEPGGGSDPNTYEVEDLATTVSAGDSQQDVADAGAGGGKYNQGNLNAVNDWIQYTTPVIEAGAYNVKVRYRKGPEMGMWQFFTIGEDVGSPIDAYAASPSYIEVDLGNVTAANTGAKVLRFTITGKNGSSSDFKTAIDYVKLTVPIQ